MYSKDDTIVLNGTQANEIQELINNQQRLIETLQNEVKLKEQKYIDVKWDYNDLLKELSKLRKKVETYSHEYNKAKELGDLMAKAYKKEKSQKIKLQDEAEFLKSRLEVSHKMYSKKTEYITSKKEPKVAKRTYKFEEVYV